MKDLRVKLTAKERQEILDRKGKDTMAGLAREFHVSCRTIEFIHFPERKEANLRRRAERGGWKQYYDKGRANAANKKYLARKRGKTNV
jgi:hypothetical protein